MKSPVTLGTRYGRLVVTVEIKDRRKVKCRCDCGKSTLVYRTNLQQGFTGSCGCGQGRRARALIQEAI